MSATVTVPRTPRRVKPLELQVTYTCPRCQGRDSGCEDCGGVGTAVVRADQWSYLYLQDSADCVEFCVRLEDRAAVVDSVARSRRTARQHAEADVLSASAMTLRLVALALREVLAGGGAPPPATIANQNQVAA